MDQPDLKAKMNLSVVSPSEWKKVLSNEYATLEKDLNVEEYLKASTPCFSGEVSEYLKGKEGKMTTVSYTHLTLPTIYSV